MQKKPIILLFFLLFAGIFSLSMDFWSWDKPVTLGVLGLPSWIFDFLILQLVLVVVMFLFARFAWPDEEESEGESS